MTLSEKVKVIAEILLRHADLTNNEAIWIAYKIIDALNQPETKVEIGPAHG